MTRTNESRAIDEGTRSILCPTSSTIGAVGVAGQCRDTCGLRKCDG